jgi:probable FeS assembly SUF system protein SufT
MSTEDPSTSGSRHAPGPHDKTLVRDVQSTLIPAGEPAVLPAGTRVTITHRLGGNFTVVCDTGMFRINGTDADALGEEVPTEATAGSGTTDTNGSRGTAEHPGHSGPPSDEALWNQLKTVFDPEIPVNIVDLGLVYSLSVEPVEDKTDHHRVKVAMTLTAPGCGMGPVIAEDARNRLLGVPGAHEAIVEIVWDPPWTQTMISEDGKMQLGLI